MSSRLPGRAGWSGEGVNRGGSAVATGVSALATAGTGAAFTPSSAARKKSDRPARAGDGAGALGNSGEGTGGRIALMPTGLMKTVGNGLTAPAGRQGAVGNGRAGAWIAATSRSISASSTSGPETLATTRPIASTAKVSGAPLMPRSSPARPSASTSTIA
jgi:hypothetical protein